MTVRIGQHSSEKRGMTVRELREFLDRLAWATLDESTSPTVRVTLGGKIKSIEVSGHE